MTDVQKNLACYALTAEGAALARRLAQTLNTWAVDIFAPQRHCREGETPFDSLPVLVAQTYTRYAAHVFVGATGIAVRSIATHITHKSTDPAVMVCDEQGHYAINLLAGHWGGGNDLARELAHILGGEAVITTATDGRRLPAPDLAAREAGCVILDWDAIKMVNAALLEGHAVQLYDPLDVLNLPLDTGHFTSVADTSALMPPTPAVCADWRRLPPALGRLRLAVPALYVGIGCRRGVPAGEIVEAVRDTLEQAGLEPAAVACLASVEAKEDEPGLQEAAREWGVPLQIYSVEELADAPVLTPSAIAAQLFGVESICVSEGAALLAAGGPAEAEAALLVPKQRHSERITVAVAVPESLLPEIPEKGSIA